MQLIEALGISDERVIALAGAGGKTTLLRRLGQEFARAGRRVLLTSTTKIEPQAGLDTVQVADLQALQTAIADRTSWAGPLLAVTGRLPTRLAGIAAEWVDTLSATSPPDVILAQTDGSSRRTFKAPLDHEPVIPTSAELVVTVLGADVFGQPLNSEWTHRPERIAELSGLNSGDPLTPEAVAHVVLNPRGSFHNTPSSARRAVLINKVEGESRLRAASDLAQRLAVGGVGLVVLASLKSDRPIIKVVNREA